MRSITDLVSVFEAATPGFPQGRLLNKGASPGTGSKTEAEIINDLLYGFYALIAQYGSLSGTAEKTTASDFLNALEAMVRDNSVPVGAELPFACATAPDGWLPETGLEVSRATYAKLWAFAQASGQLKTELEWQSLWGAGNPVGFFSSGDGSTTFRIPDVRGALLRVFDNGRGVDSGRVLSTFQDDELRSHSHTIPGGFWTNAIDVVAAGTGAAGLKLVNTTAATGGVETRPKNIARIMFIKY